MVWCGDGVFAVGENSVCVGAHTADGCGVGDRHPVPADCEGVKVFCLSVSFNELLGVVFMDTVLGQGASSGCIESALVVAIGCHTLAACLFVIASDVICHLHPLREVPMLHISVWIYLVWSQAGYTTVKKWIEDKSRINRTDSNVQIMLPAAVE